MSNRHTRHAMEECPANDKVGCSGCRPAPRRNRADTRVRIEAVQWLRAAREMVGSALNTMNAHGRANEKFYVEGLVPNGQPFRWRTDAEMPENSRVDLIVAESHIREAIEQLTAVADRLHARRKAIQHAAEACVSCGASAGCEHYAGCAVIGRDQ